MLGEQRLRRYHKRIEPKGGSGSANANAGSLDGKPAGKFARNERKCQILGNWLEFQFG